ncbi:hypothetical protein [Paenibacillus campinasensis]|uniref:Uncharacterized protein n=1 Tax=Paenibacillus campinasensis TaxID=66347 RepID=A0A268EUZ4_9BACL|nr:hypothetical protein [Paenibacillus campinasensis]MUG68574.1 hypothetical protein [Paenibacillus campinasensis]PAD76940.1 hypothetical protein CHH67_11230 [Paenibacillus campinasensis]
MKSKHWNMLWIVVAGIIVTGMIAAAVQSRTTFKALVHDAIGDPENTYSIVMHKYAFGKLEPGIEITDRERINQVFEQLSDLELRAAESRGIDERYVLWFRPSSGPTIHVTFHENRVQISNSLSRHKKYASTYEIVNEFDFNEVKALFENSQ